MPPSTNATSPQSSPKRLAARPAEAYEGIFIRVQGSRVRLRYRLHADTRAAVKPVRSSR